MFCCVAAVVEVARNKCNKMCASFLLSTVGNWLDALTLPYLSSFGLGKHLPQVLPLATPMQ